MKILLDINELQKVNECLNNVINIKKTYGDAVIEIVAHGSAAIPMQEQVAKNLKIYDGFNELSNKNVTICVCNNSLNLYDIKKESLCSFVKVVKAGMIEVVDREKEGYLYTKI